MGDFAGNYSLGNVIVVVDSDIITGPADGVFADFEFTVDRFTDKVGGYGNVSRTENQDRTGMFTLNLQATSAANAKLSALANSSATFSIEITDTNSTGTIVRATTAWIPKMAKYEAGQEMSNRAWQIKGADCSVTLAGADS